MTTDEARSLEEVSDLLEQEAGGGAEAAILSPVRQWMVLSGIVVAGTSSGSFLRSSASTLQSD
ncbi:MAG: hypothetical protein JRH16_02925 [Deltaproteobacteria bacterium]|nr:hypothetical protein [Deltaproteobacteria bacterium]MBW2362228.1 hypothetical protein [Deltaproteobacteria bacterium]